MSRRTAAIIFVASAVVGIVPVVAMASVSSANDRVKVLEDKIKATDAKMSEMDARPSAVVDRIPQGTSRLRSRAEAGQEVVSRTYFVGNNVYRIVIKRNIPQGSHTHWHR